jgi:hypothetical protein
MKKKSKWKETAGNSLHLPDDDSRVDNCAYGKTGLEIRILLQNPDPVVKETDRLETGRKLIEGSPLIKEIADIFD